MNCSLFELMINIPNCLVGHIVTEWLLITDVCKLDTACCNRFFRPRLLSIFSSGDVVYDSIPPPIDLLETIPHLLSWLKKRGITMSTMEITPDLDFDLLNRYLQLTARKLKFLSLQNLIAGTDDIVQMLATQGVEQICTIRCTYSNVGATFNSLLRLPKKLEEIRFNWCHSVHSGVFAGGLLLPHVRTASVRCSHVDSHFTQAFATACSNVQFLNLGNCGMVNDEATLAIARNCPLLKIVSLAGHNTTDAAVVQLSKSCPHLVLIDIGGCVQLTNVSIISIAQNCRNLQRLYMNNNNNFTDAALGAITEYCSAAFEVLHVAECPDITTDGVIHVLERCPKLITLYVGCEVQSHSIDLPAILKKCGKIEKLCVYLPVIDKDMLLFIAHNCKCIAELGLYTVEEGVTEEGLVALATHCVQLETLVLNPLCDVMTSFAKQLWKVLRPGLEIHTDPGDALAFDMEIQLDWYSEYFEKL